MCPLMECLVTIVSSKGTCFEKMGPQIFMEASKMIAKAENQKQIVIRAVDLLSALIALRLSTILGWVSSDQEFHSNIVYGKLLCSTEPEVISFTYGLIGDICKSTPMKL